jgi:vacuolar-type H+-ATPase subunit I/STV1
LAANNRPMKFARIVFWIAGVWGVLILTPLYFIFDLIGRQDPPPITHPGFYYGFVSVGLAFQVAFIVIALDPVRLRPMMIPAILEKFGGGLSFVILYMQHRLKPGDLTLGCIDLLFGILFVAAFIKTATNLQSTIV